MTMIGRRGLMALGGAALLLPPAAFAQSGDMKRAIRGTLGLGNWTEFAAFIASQVDGDPIGIDVYVRSDEAPPPEEEPLAGVSGGRLVIFSRAAVPDGDQDFQAEIVAGRGYRAVRGGYYLGGTYRVMNGGMHQGILSYGLVPDRVSARVVRGFSRGWNITTLG
jgi:hypothetical protein